jgi:hypothetical protein
MPEYPYDRFAHFPPAQGFVARVRSIWFSTRNSVSKRISHLRMRLSAWWYRRKREPIVAFDLRTGQPVLAGLPNRVDERIVNWNSLTELKARAADSYEPTGRRHAEIPMLIYEGEEAWAEQLPEVIRLMTSEEYARRVCHLLATNRISHDEYRTLTGLSW